MPLTVPSVVECPFCQNLSGARECVFVRRLDQVASFVNPRQFERGSLLVIPMAHYSTVLDVPRELLGEIYGEAQTLAGALVRALGATGVNIFQNNGTDAGQSVPHFHVHVVPRYPGSDPHRVFGSEDHERSPLQERAAIAAAIRRVLE